MGLVVGIGGISRAGKSSLCVTLKSGFPKLDIHVLNMDDYALPEDQIPQIQGRPDWESPQSIDYLKLLGDVRHSRAQHQITLVEGILVFNDPDLNAQYDKRVEVVIDKQLFQKRKRQDPRWPEPEWYIEHIWQSYVKFNSTDADIVRVDGSTPFNLQEISTRILGDYASA